jgi:hypothetical protein
VYRIQKGRVLDEDDEPVKDVITVGLQNLIEGNKNPLSDYNEAFRNLQARRRMKPVTPESARQETEATEAITSVHIAKEVPRRQDAVAQLESTTVTSMDDVDIDSEAEEAVYEGFSILDEPEASEEEPTFATMGADDVALDMDTECGYITSDESSDESEDDLDESVYWVS